MIAPSNPNSGGRPSKFTAAIRAKIIKLLKGGNYRCVAARASGVSERVLARWLAEGRKKGAERESFRQFRHAVLEAEAAAEAFHVGQINKAAKKDYRASVEWLQRKQNRRWSKTDRLEHTGKNGGPIRMKAVAAAKELRRQVIDDPATLALVRERHFPSNGHAGDVRPNGESGAVDDGAAPSVN